MNTKDLLIPLILFLILPFIISAKQRADFMVVEAPLVFTIYDKYERLLKESNKKRFIPYSPFQIINKNEILGDEITQTLKFKFEGSNYYVLKDDNGKLTSTTSTYKKEFRNCAIINDTIHIVKDKSFLIYEKYPSLGKRTYLKKGDIVLRVFKYNGHYCLLNIGSNRIYGWNTLRSGTSWQLIKKEISKNKHTISQNIQEQITNKIKSINDSYTKYFNYFNNRTNSQKSIPEWKYETKGNIITITLSGAGSYAMQLNESSQYLVSDLENILLGISFSVEYETVIITISPKI